MKRFVLILLVVALGQTASAQVMTLLHDGDRVVSVTYPDGWQIRMPRLEQSNIIAAIPDDGSLLWQGLWVLREVGTIEQALERLHSLEARLFSDVKQTKDLWQEQVGELTVYNHEGTGMYEGSKSISFFVTLLQVGDQRVAALAYMGDPAAIEQYQDDLSFIVQSLRLENK